jgi:tetratricopeptide (TPR) repeat protein
LADSYKGIRNYGKAIELWTQYLRHDPHNVTVLTRIADAYRKVKNLQKSKEMYEQVLQIEKDNPYALIGLGHLYFDFKEYDKALHYWERMIQAHPDSIDIRLLTSIGNCFRKMKAYRRGIEYFSKALEKEKDNFYALFGLADCYRGLNQHEESLTYWNRILEKDPHNKVILTRAGDAYRAMGKLAQAEEFYRKALNIEYDAYAVLGLALIAKEKGRYQEALESLEQFRKTDPKNARLYGEIADCYLRMGEKEKALEVVSAALKGGIHNTHLTELFEKLHREVKEP